MIGVWASISRRRGDGTLEQMDRGGNPTINPDGEKDLYNSRQPADDVANYLGPWSKVRENAGYPPEEAEAAALQVLPDILRYDSTKPPFYPNGRRPIEDIYSYRFAWLSHGKVPPQGLKPHADLLTDFPYLGPPSPDGQERSSPRRRRDGYRRRRGVHLAGRAAYDGGPRPPRLLTRRAGPSPAKRADPAPQVRIEQPGRTIGRAGPSRLVIRLHEAGCQQGGQRGAGADHYTQRSTNEKQEHQALRNQPCNARDSATRAPSSGRNQSRFGRC